MKSFRTELEDPVVENDILQLEKKIRLFKKGKVDEERFRSLRLARGVYGQRQPGVQMIRIKVPYGKLTAQQLLRIAEVSDEYSNGKLHITTRQDIQIHYVSLDRTPQLWHELEKDKITLREACGNTVRNVTASAMAGIDPFEPFDVTSCADAVFKYFLRNPVCQEMGRKFKISFSSSETDTALAYIHDLGFIPLIKNRQKGFRVLLGGGLGSQPRAADLFNDFLPVPKLIPFIESVLRVFDHYGERNKRLKARMKFLIKEIGLPAFKQLIAEQQQALSVQEIQIKVEPDYHIPTPRKVAPRVIPDDLNAYENWKNNNVFAQKQAGYYAIGIKITLGNFSTDNARQLAQLIRTYGGNELRFTLRQNILLRHIPENALSFFFTQLQQLNMAEASYNSTADITACPGTDTCNLAITSSTGISLELEKVLKEEFPHFLSNKNITIKISGCMNACGQHNMAHIGFQGMSVRLDQRVAPALQVLLGGGTLGNGKGRFADKVIKIPARRGPQALRLLIDDFQKNGKDNFLDYYDQKGKIYFYQLLKPLADITTFDATDFIDWGRNTVYTRAVGTGECAGVVIDLISTLFFESQEKIQNARQAYNQALWADSIYHSYSAFINTAKALLLLKDIKTNSQATIVREFDKAYAGIPDFYNSERGFSETVYQMRKSKASAEFAREYLNEAAGFCSLAQKYHQKKEVYDK